MKSRILLFRWQYEYKLRDTLYADNAITKRELIYWCLRRSDALVLRQIRPSTACQKVTSSWVECATNYCNFVFTVTHLIFVSTVSIVLKDSVKYLMNLEPLFLKIHQNRASIVTRRDLQICGLCATIDKCDETFFLLYYDVFFNYESRIMTVILMPGVPLIFYTLNSWRKIIEWQVLWTSIPKCFAALKLSHNSFENHYSLF